MGVEIRNVRIDDLPVIFHMGEELFTSQRHSNLYRTWDEFEVTALYQSDPDLCLVAWDEEKEKVVGFLLATTYEKTGSAWSYGHIAWLGVEPLYGRAGLGTSLFNAIIEVMKNRGIRILIIDTQADNKTAISFFERMGFSQTTEHVYMSMNLENLGRQSQSEQKKSRRKQT
ncbi:MAG: GNAT family N-acetyltransferase [Chitinivibrionales bacterium]|nr:GNAT family N-acetyltransferase [Chitinivibrionales bacterium]